MQTIKRNYIWKENYTLWTDLGNAYKHKGLIEKAIGEYQNALRLKPNSAEIYDNIGTTYLAQGLTDKATEYYQIALKLNPS